ncbi:MAG: thioredoxin family protein [Ferrovibrio sp.]
MLTRRLLLAAGPAALAALAATGVRAAPAGLTMGEDGLYHFDWYLESFLDFAEDLEGATKAGKRLAVLWGLKGCPACRLMHEDYMADTATTGYIRANFEILHLNILGSREVTDFDGTRLPEKAMAAKYGIRSTPTIQFFPEKADGLAGKPVLEREVTRMHGLLPKPDFLRFFRYVRERGYERADFGAWIKTAS